MNRITILPNVEVSSMRQLNQLNVRFGRWIRLATICALMAGVIGCGDSVSLVVVTPSSVAFDALGAIAQLTAEAQTTSNQPVTGQVFAWSSSSDAVATVDRNGRVTATGNGTATIEAMTQGFIGTATITVSQIPTTVGVNPSNLTLHSLGETAVLSGVARDANGADIVGQLVEWSSVDPSVATVSESGVVTAVADGNTTVQARSGNALTNVSVTVSQTAALVVVSPSVASFETIGETLQFLAAVSDARGNQMPNELVSWTSTNSNVLAIDQAGVATTVGNGNAFARATSGNATGTASVSVSQVATSMSISPDMATLVSLGETRSLEVVGEDAGGAQVFGIEATWSSSNVAVATVNGSGVVTAVADGDATILATSGSLMAEAMITVTQTAADVIITPNQATLTALGDSVQLTAVTTDALGNIMSDAPITWASQNMTIAIAHDDGVVEAVANGIASVTASSDEVSSNAIVIVSQATAVLTVDPTSASFASIGETIQFTASAVDARGHPVAGAGIQWGTDAPGVATVNSAGLATAIANGAATLQVVSGALAEDIPVTVQQLPADLRFAVAPTSTLAGAILNPISVAIFDALGNGITFATDLVTLNLAANPTGAIMSGTLSQNAVGGVAVFDDLSIDLPGSEYTIAATVGNLTTTSRAFTIGQGITGAWSGDFNAGAFTLQGKLVEEPDGSITGYATLYTSGVLAGVLSGVGSRSIGGVADSVEVTFSQDPIQPFTLSGTWDNGDGIVGTINGSGFVDEPIDLTRVGPIPSLVGISGPWTGLLAVTGGQAILMAELTENENATVSGPTTLVGGSIVAGTISGTNNTVGVPDSVRLTHSYPGFQPVTLTGRWDGLDQIPAVLNGSGFVNTPFTYSRPSETGVGSVPLVAWLDSFRRRLLTDTSSQESTSLLRSLVRP